MTKNKEPEELQVFHELYKEEYQRLCNLVYRIIGEWDAAEELVHDMFFKTWNKRSDLKKTTSPKDYLFKNVIQGTATYLENALRKGKVIEVSDQNYFTLIKPDGTAYPNERNNKFMTLLSHLTPRTKIIFILKKFEGIELAEIAKILGISQKLTEEKMGNALEKLSPVFFNESESH